MAQKRMICHICHGVGIYDSEQDRFFCMDCGYDSQEEEKLAAEACIESKHGDCGDRE